MDSGPQRIIVAGLGGRGREWLATIGGDPRWQIAALVDPHAPGLQAAAESTTMAPECCFAGLDQALAAVPADAVLVVTPLAEHYAGIRSSLLAGRHVLTEKPFVADMAQARELVALAASRGLTLGVAQNYRYEAPYRALEQALKREIIGRVATASIRFHRHRPVLSYGLDEPAPFLFIQGIHFLDALRALFACEARSAAACSANPPWSPYYNPARWEGLVTMENGVLVHVSGSYVGMGRQTPYWGLWRVEGETGDLYLEEAPEGGVRLVHSWNDGRDEERLPLLPVTPGRQVLLDQFRESLQGGPEMPTSGRDNLGTLALVSALVASSRSGCAEQVLPLQTGT